jgi:hypothetical protein
MPSISEIEAYIRNAAIRRGIDPDAAVHVAKSQMLAPGDWSPSGGTSRIGIGGIAAGLTPAALDFVKNNPQPGGYGPGVPDPNRPGTGSGPMRMFGSTSPARPPAAYKPSAAGANRAPPDGGAGEGGGGRSENPSLGERLAAAGQAFHQAMNKYPAPAIQSVPGFSGDTGNALLTLLKNPNAMALALLARRMG